jgi:tetratricopeptide (TPR) repeat protein
MIRHAAVVVLALAACAQIDPRAALLERAGFEALNRGRVRLAADTFREAIDADPKNPLLHLGAGMAAALERRDRDAHAALERALALDRTLTAARVLLGQIQCRMGDRAGAMRTYETVVAEMPGDAEARATLERWRREAELHDVLAHEFMLETTGGDAAHVGGSGAAVPLGAPVTGFSRLSDAGARRAYATSARAAFEHRIQRSFADFQAALSIY